MTEQTISTILAVAGVTEDDLGPIVRRQIASARADSALAAELTEKWRGRYITGTRASYVWPHEPVPFEGTVRRVVVGNPYRVPHAVLTDGQTVPLPGEGN